MQNKPNILLIYTGGTIGMIKDFEISNRRSSAGSKGGFATAKSIASAIAKTTANTEYEYVPAEEAEA